MSPSDLSAVVLAMIPTQEPFLIVGGSGLGKSSIAFQAASGIYNGSTIASAVGGFPDVPWFIPFPAMDKDVTDVGGMRFIANGKVQWAPSDLLDRMWSAPDGGLLCIEELPQAVPLMQCVLREPLLNRTIGGKAIPPNWSVGATGNRQQDRAGANRVLSHVASSVTWLSLEADLDDWQRWALEKGIAQEVRSFLRFMPDQFAPDMDPAKTVNATPRSWERLSNVLAAIPERLRFSVFKGIVGDGAAGVFIDYLKLYANLPDPDAVLKSPGTAPVPTEASVLWALTGAIMDRVRKGKEQVGKAASMYATRLPKKFAVALVLDVLGIFSQGTMWPELNGWVVENIHLLRPVK